MRRHRWFWGLLILGSLIACQRPQQEATEEPVAKAVPVKVATAMDTLIVETTRVSGEIQARSQVELYPKAPGIILNEKVRLGQYVKKNDVLAEFKQDIPGMEFTPVKIKATQAGLITMDAVEIGSNVSPQRSVYRISQVNPINFVVQLVESLLGKVNTSNQVKVKLAAFPETTFSGRIQEISPLIDPASRTSQVKIELNNAHRHLKPGMFGQAILTIGQHRGLVVPLDAIIQRGITRSVFRVDSGKATRLTVNTGVILNDVIEIQSTNLHAGDSIVVLGQNLLDDGMDVRITEEFE